MFNLTSAVSMAALPISDLRWVRDLDYFDGPLLSLFRGRKSGNSYLFYWCDSDEFFNRWMVCRISETNLIRLSNRKIPLDQVIPHGCEDDFVYFVDIDGNRVNKHVWLSLTTSVPEEYTPSTGTFLSNSIADDTGVYHILIERGLSDSNVRELLRRFACAYAFLYNVIKLKSEKFRSHPWRGGFSALHFWNEILNVIPTEAYPNLQAMRFSSPGFIKYQLDSDIATEVGNFIYRYIHDNDESNKAHLDLQAYNRLHKLKDIESDTDPNWPKHNDELKIRTSELLRAMRLPMATEYMAACRTPYQAAKMAQFFFRRVQELAELEISRLVSFPGDEGRSANLSE